MSQSYEELSVERKEMQEKGWLPDWYTTFGWQMFKSKYSYGGEEGAKGRWKTIAKTLANMHRATRKNGKRSSLT